MPTIYWYGSCPLLRNLKIEELWELNQDQKGLQNPQENQTGVNETIKKRQVTHRPSNLIITKRGTKNMPLDILSDSSGLNVPPVAETNVPGIAETNVPAVAE